MALREILTFPNPLLAETSTDVTSVTDELRTLIRDMVETMYDAPGIGLAAPQVGVLKNIIVVDVPEEVEGEGEDEPTWQSCLIVLLNPKIEEASGEICYDEGCLSVPELEVKVRRAREIVVTGLDQNGEDIRLNCSELQAVAVQHEMDHLKGILITDHASHLKRSLYAKKIKKREKAKKL